MLLYLRSDSQIQKYLYKIVIVYVKAISITWSKFISGEAVICHSRYQANFGSQLIMSLYWYACISINTDIYIMYDIF